jgi:hypothetical protein
MLHKHMQQPHLQTINHNAADTLSARHLQYDNLISHGRDESPMIR